jgi:hypothetical protein
MEKGTIITTPIDNDSTNPWLFIGVIIVVLIILVGAFVIYWFLIRKPPPPPVNTCTGQTCQYGQYCSSSGQCISGSGNPAGHSCSKNTDCNYGYNCVSQYCLSNTVLPVKNLPNKFQLISTFGTSKVIYYLDATNSTITTTQPTTSFSYDPVTQLISVNGTVSNNRVTVDTQGHLSTGISGYPLTLVGTDKSLQIQYSCGSILSFKNINSSSSISVFFPQTSTQSCPTDFEPSLGAVPMIFTVQPVNDTPVSVQSYNQMPVQSYNQMPVQNYNQIPVQNYNQIPVQNYNQMPIQNYNQIPVQSYNQMPTQNYNQMPTQNYNQMPTQNYNQMPIQNYNQMPVQNYNQMPVQNYNQMPVQNYNQMPVQTFTQYSAPLQDNQVFTQCPIQAYENTPVATDKFANTPINFLNLSSTLPGKLFGSGPSNFGLETTYHSPSYQSILGVNI